MDNRLRNNTDPQQKIITINDVADELGLSKTTISRALSGKGRIGAETRERVLSYIAERGYQPSHIAKSLAVSRTFNIAVTLPTDAEAQEIPFFQTCLHAITETAAARDYDVLLSVTTGRDVSALERIMRNRKVDGVILTRLVSGDRALGLLREFGVPFAIIGSIRDTSITQVDSDHRSGCREVMEHVLSSGCRTHALLAGNPGFAVNKDRYAGYLAALEGAGLRADGSSEFHDESPAVAKVAATSDDETLDDATLVAALRAAMDRKVDCLVCMDDVICDHALAWLRREGYRVPNDARIVSFHDSSALERNEPPVTALHIDVPALARTAVTALLNEIEGKPFDRINRIGYSLKIRDSSRA